MARVQPLLPCIAVTLFLHVFSRAPCTTQDALMSPCLSPGPSPRHVLSPVPSTEGTGVGPGGRGTGWAHPPAFPLCRAPVQVSLLSQPSSFRKYMGVSCLWDRHCYLGWQLANESKIIGDGQAKSVQLWIDVGKTPTDRENQINLLLENCMAVLTRWEYIREIGKNINLINSTS